MVEDPSESNLGQGSVLEKRILRNIEIDLLEIFVLGEHLVVGDEFELFLRKFGQNTVFGSFGDFCYQLVNLCPRKVSLVEFSFWLNLDLSDAFLRWLLWSQCCRCGLVEAFLQVVDHAHYFFTLFHLFLVKLILSQLMFHNKIEDLVNLLHLSGIFDLDCLGESFLDSVDQVEVV